jgi:hypothetical protein
LRGNPVGANADWYETPADGIAAGLEGRAYKPA